MFSTRPGEALPVRTPANSLCTTSSVLSIFSSASSKISSSAIRLDRIRGREGGQSLSLGRQTEHLLSTKRRHKARAKRTVSPLTPALSPLRGEGKGRGRPHSSIGHAGRKPAIGRLKNLRYRESYK